MFDFTSVSGTAALLDSPPPPVALSSLEQQALALGLKVIPLARVREYQDFLVDDLESLGTDFTGMWERAEYSEIADLKPPPDVAADIKRATHIMGARVFAEWFEEDPFVFVSQHMQGEALEVICIGFWNAPGFKA